MKSAGVLLRELASQPAPNSATRKRQRPKSSRPQRAARSLSAKSRGIIWPLIATAATSVSTKPRTAGTIVPTSLTWLKKRLRGCPVFGWLWAPGRSMPSGSPALNRGAAAPRADPSDRPADARSAASPEARAATQTSFGVTKSPAASGRAGSVSRSLTQRGTRKFQPSP